MLNKNRAALSPITNGQEELGLTRGLTEWAIQSLSEVGDQTRAVTGIRQATNTDISEAKRSSRAIWK